MPLDPFPVPYAMNGGAKLLTSYGLFPGPNIQVTSGTPRQARSESVIAVNPRNRNNLIAASKKFSNPDTYRFQVGVRVSFDGGENWHDATLPLLPEWNEINGDLVVEQPGMTDPAVAFDDFGNAFMMGEPIRYMDAIGKGIITLGMYVYKSTDGGLHWSAPVPLHVGDNSDDKSWIACDNNPTSPHYGNVYIAWGAGSPLRFRRSTDHGATWKNFGNNTPDVPLAEHASEPEISVGLDGTVHIAWHIDGGTTIEYMRSIDGGETFSPQRSIVTGVHSLRTYLDYTGEDKWPHFPNATFRVITLVTCCGFGYNPFGRDRLRFLPGPQNVIVAWSDYREGAARIYYRASSDGGATFQGPDEGQPLLGDRQIDSNLHHFHPQIVSTGTGVVGCAFYEYGPKAGRNLIDVKLAASFDRGHTFPYAATVTDTPWDPVIDAPYSHGDKQVTFIGEYFGIDADDTGFAVLWTDTRTGVQELFYARVDTEKLKHPRILDGISAQILVGVIGDGDGAIIVNGHIVPVPPRGPEYDLVHAMVALDAAGKIGDAPGSTLVKEIYRAIETIAARAGNSPGLG